MIKVFLVEDEVVMRNGIKNSIPWEKEGFSFVGDASDGELAYPLIKKMRPDILITDIKMPFMDGLELSRIVKKEMPGIKIVILSGHNEFDFAKTAISIGVTDYLLKPITPARLLEAIRNVAAVIEKEREQAALLERYEEEMQERIAQEKHSLWADLTSNRLSIAELLEKGQQLGIDFTAAVYQVFLFKIMQGGDASRCSDEMFCYSEKIEKIAEHWENVLTFDRSPEGWAFLLKGESKEEIFGRLELCKMQLVDLMKTAKHLEYFGGVGTVVSRIKDVQKSYQEAGKAFSGRFFSENNRIISCNEMEQLRTYEDGKIDIRHVSSRKTELQRVEQFLKDGTLEEIDAFLDEYIYRIGTKNYQSFLYRQYVTMDLYFSAMDVLNSMGHTQEELAPHLEDINEIVAKVMRGESLSKLIAPLFHEIIRLRNNSARHRNEELIEEAKKYIRENYPSEDMCLNKVAAQVNISPGYFSSIFSNETKQTFVEYLTMIRMDKAKELLMGTGMRTSEIGFAVGYKDSHYFSYIFKKSVGCSPKEFRNRGKDTI